METIKELTDGMHFNSQLLVNSMSKGVTSQGRSYLTISFQDASGTIEGKKWDVDEEDLEIFVAGNIVLVEGEAINYRDHLQIKVLSGMLLSQDNIDITRFVPSAPVSQKELEDKLNRYLDSLSEGDLKKLTTHLITKYKDAYLIFPAAVRNHHNYASGLLYHSLSMANLAEEVCRLYPHLNRDFLIAGTLLHDLGKTIELSGVIATKYTNEGKLLGHISILVGEIRVAAKELGIVSEVPLLLEHMVLSHHSKPEFGSPVPPMTREALALSLIDDFDAKMNIVDKAMEGIMKGEWTERIFALDQRSFYVPDYDALKKSH